MKKILLGLLLISFSASAGWEVTFFNEKCSNHKLNFEELVHCSEKKGIHISAETHPKFQLMPQQLDELAPYVKACIDKYLYNTRKNESSRIISEIILQNNRHGGFGSKQEEYRAYTNKDGLVKIELPYFADRIYKEEISDGYHQSYSMLNFNPNLCINFFMENGVSK